MLFRPALCASMREGTMMLGGTLRKRIKASCSNEMLTPDTRADIHKKKGTKWKNTERATKEAMAITTIKPIESSMMK